MTQCVERDHIAAPLSLANLAERHWRIPRHRRWDHTRTCTMPWHPWATTRIDPFQNKDAGPFWAILSQVAACHCRVTVYYNMQFLHLFARNEFLSCNSKQRFLKNSFVIDFRACVSCQPEVWTWNLRMGWKPSFYSGGSGECHGNSADCGHASGMPSQNIGLTPLSFS